MAKWDIKQLRLEELLYQALETEIGAADVYRTALRCAAHPQLTLAWQRYLDETEAHVATLREIFEVLDLDADAETPGRAVARHLAESLMEAMEMALEGPRGGAERIAAECVVHAETKNHLDWELIGAVLNDGKLPRDLKRVLSDALAWVEREEDEHLYHSEGWTRELWIQALGMPSVLPPPEEARELPSAPEAARAERARKELP